MVLYKHIIMAIIINLLLSYTVYIDVCRRVTVFRSFDRGLYDIMLRYADIIL